MELQPTETYLKGDWVFEDGSMKADEVTKRIQWLITHSLNRVGNDKTGWKILYQDVGDGRYWEYTYEQSQMNGGGPPSLIFITDEDVELKYGLV
jgi:hypothetical protein